MGRVGAASHRQERQHRRCRSGPGLRARRRSDRRYLPNEAYDPSTNTWAAMPPMPTARHGLGAVARNNRVYVLAGGPDVGGSQSGLNEVFILIPGAGP